MASDCLSKVQNRCTHSSPEANNIIILVHQLALLRLEEFKCLFSCFALRLQQRTPQFQYKNCSEVMFLHKSTKINNREISDFSLQL